MLTRNRVALFIAAVLIAAGVSAGALAATGGTDRAGSSTGKLTADGAALGLEVATGDRIDTPSGKFMTVTSKTFTAGSGPIAVRFAGEGYEEDWNAEAQFVGKSYAAMKVRVLLNGAPLAPGAVTLLDNSGKIGERSSLQGSRASAAAFDWAGTVSTGGPQTIEVQFRNLRTWDSATLLRWTLTIIHA